MNEYDGIPTSTLRSINEFVKEGTPVGQFLSALLSRDLFKAVDAADGPNITALPYTVRYIVNCCPVGAYGSAEEVENWTANRGAKQFSPQAEADIRYKLYEPYNGG